ncbi:transcript variant X1 [Nothobranchius furzeri]|uniref:Transcript variant X1 n=1 Tax=Nothobranchius furzeri TaxID=105023 RepID=A0A9D2YJM6_NOTFU|nr:transcript variant X1 [Nothobranchius furzeri]
MAASCMLRAVLNRVVKRFGSSGGHTKRLIFGHHLDFWVTETRPETSGGTFPLGGGGAAGGRRGGGGAALCAAIAFSLFRSDEDQTKEDEMILLLKKAKLSIHRGQLQAASSFFHQVLVLAHQTHNNQAIIYTYSQMANLAFVQGQLDSAEKLFKAAMNFMLVGGAPQDDNAIIEMSLKLATIYAEQNKLELAEHGFMFCTESLEAKLEKHKELSEEEKTGEAGRNGFVTVHICVIVFLSPEEQEALRKETRLLLGLCLDSRARYRASALRLTQAAQDYQNALDICRQEQGETHPQTLVLMSDLATILDLQGRHDEALVLVQHAVHLSQSVGHPDHHVLLGNMAGILLHTGQLEDSVRFYQEALGLARQAGDQEAMNHIKDGLKEVEKRRSQERYEKRGSTTMKEPEHGSV